MVANAGDEFRATATPSQELLSRLAYLAQIGSRSVMPRGFTAKTAFMGADAGANSTLTQAMLRAARLADPAYQEMSARITGKLTRMDEASVAALQGIEQEVQEIARERDRMRERAFRDEQGRLMLMTEDESGAYYEDGNRVADDDFAVLRDALRGRTRWNEWEDLGRRRRELDTERGQIHTHDTQRNQLREDLAAGRIPKEEAEVRERTIEESMPARVRRRYAPAEAAPTAELQTGSADPAAHFTPLPR
jgi:hypothetical protein